ncbi:MAG TPA: phosphate ABC transporter permease subunit PstC [Candidatus Dormibacteraeota bacterium]
MVGVRALAGARQQRPSLDNYQRLLVALGLLIPALLVLIIAMLFIGSRESMGRFAFGFLTGRTWDPVHQQFAALPFIYGTFVSSLIALLLALIIGVAVAIFLAEPGLAWLKGPIGIAIELLAAIPSVVYGIWALFVMAPWVYLHISSVLADKAGQLPVFAQPAQQASMLAGALVLTVMILPSLAAVSRDVIRAVPGAMREASYALGTTWWETTWRVVLPAARAGIFGAVILAFGRAVGETIAVTMVIGNRPFITASVVQPAYTLASVIANEFVEATGGLYISALIELGLILILLTLVLNFVALLLIRSVTRE